MSLRREVVASMAAIVFAGSAISAQGALLRQFDSANYDLASGRWSDTSDGSTVADNTNDAFNGYAPGLVAGATLSGQSALSFNGSQNLIIGGFNDGSGTGIPISPTSTFTLFAVVKPTTGGTILAGNGGSLQYRLSGSKQESLRAGQASQGASNTVLPTDSFSIISLTFTNGSNPSGTFYLNNVADGSFTASGGVYGYMTFIGAKDNSGAERYNGQIAAVRIYDTVLDSTERTAVFSSLAATYVPEPVSLSVFGLLGAGLLCRRRR